MSSQKKDFDAAKLGYHYTECGLDNVYLKNGYRFGEHRSEKGVAFENIDGLHQAIGLALVNAPSPLRGKEFRFLRIELGPSQAGLGKLFGVDKQTIARWEKGETYSAEADRLIRLIYAESILGAGNLREIIQRLADRDDIDHDYLVFKEQRGKWNVFKEQRGKWKAAA